MAQFRQLAQRVRGLGGKDKDSQLTARDLMSIGYKPDAAEHIIHLLSQKEQMDWYVREGKKWGCVPITRVSEGYPAVLKKRLGFESPGCLWAKGDISLLEKPAIALVGSRDLRVFNEAFATEVGIQAAAQGYVLVSGNARGADRAAQDGCLTGGGKVISVVADALINCPYDPNVLYLSEEGYDLEFSIVRALSRNRVVHCLPQMTFVAQCTAGKGGTWDGTVKNLKNLWSPVFCPDDGSEGIQALINLGAEPITGTQLQSLSDLQPAIKKLIDQ